MDDMDHRVLSIFASLGMPIYFSKINLTDLESLMLFELEMAMAFLLQGGYSSWR